MRRIFFLTLLGLGANAPAAAQEGADFRKGVVELPLKETLVPQALESVPLTGLVRWHASFEGAKSAAATSGKPILLFQLLGRLDEEFC